MADPVTAGIMIVGAVVSAVGAVRQGQAQAAAADYNAKISEQNSQIAEAQGAAAVEAQQRDAQRRIGSALALYGASGVETDTGSPADVLADSARNAALDTLNVKYNAKLRSMGLSNQAELDRAEGANSKSASYINATSSLLSGGAKAYGSIAPAYSKPSGGGTGTVSTG